MFEVDFHVHTHFSGCGLHSIIEILSAARDRGVKALAVTDHGPFLGKRISSTFFERLKQPVEGINLLKGLECNLTDEDGTIDIYTKFMHYYDVVLLGFHNFPVRDGDPEKYSEIMIRALEKNPCVDIIVHPNAPHYVVDFRTIAEAAASMDIAVELNNAKTMNRRSSEAQTIELINACRDAGCMVAVNTDTHAINELADTSVMENLLDKTGFPYERIVNRNLESALEWVKKRRARRLANFPE